MGRRKKIKTKSKTKSTVATSSFRRIQFSLYGEDNCRLYDEWLTRVHLKSLKENVSRTRNVLLTEMFLSVAKEEITSNSEEIIAKLLVPAVRKALKSNVEQMYRDLLMVFGEMEKQIGKILKEIGILSSFSSKILSRAYNTQENNLSRNFEMGNFETKIFEIPSWAKELKKLDKKEEENE